METIRFTARPVIKTTAGRSILLNDDPTNHDMRVLQLLDIDDVADVVVINDEAFVYQDEGRYVAVKTTAGYKMIAERVAWAYV